jgi:hypothetical protein
MMFRSIGSVSFFVLLSLAPQVAMASGVRLKTEQDCRYEFAANRAVLAKIRRTRSAFVSICRTTPAGMPTRASYFEPFLIEPPQDFSGNSDYKLGYRFTPAYLSSPKAGFPSFAGDASAIP